MYLYGGFACDVCNQEVHGNIFTVHVSVHPVLDVSWHLVCIQIVEVLEWKQMITRCHTDILHAHFRHQCRHSLAQEYVVETTALEFALNLSVFQ